MISSDDYHRTLRKVAMVFQGRSDELQHLLQEQMQKYADRTDYESAARVRDQLHGLDQLTADQKMSLPTHRSAVMFLPWPVMSGSLQFSCFRCAPENLLGGLATQPMPLVCLLD
jgi:excinuclease UvrABC nuclease subunit